MNEHYIYFGDNASPTFSFDVDTLEDLLVNTSVDLVGEELAIDTIEFVAVIDDTDESFRSQDYATPIWYYRGIDPIGKFYLKQITRIGRTRYKVEGISLIGLLDNETHYGWYFEGASFSYAVKCILETNGVASFTGYYEKLTTDTASNCIGLATGTMKSQQTDTGDRLFHSATMHSKMQAKFTLNGFAQLTGSGTSAVYRILGATNDATGPETVYGGAVDNRYKLNYGMFMEVTRASESDPWPAFGTVYFQYGETKIDLGVPTAGTTYELDVDPVAGTAEINGTTYSITDSDVNALVPLHIWMGGAQVYYRTEYEPPSTVIVTSEIVATIQKNLCICTWEYYRLYDQDDTLLTDMKYLKHYIWSTADEDYCYVYDMGTIRTRWINQNTGAIVDEDSFVEYTGNPAFFTPSQQMETIFENITYEDGIDTIEIYGRIPVCTKREALHQLLFATGVNLVKSADGNISFASPQKQSVATITTDRIYENGSIEYPDRVNIVEAKEYSFDAETSSKTIYEAKTAPSGYYVVTYENPGLRYTNYDNTTIQEVYMGFNAAVVSGTGVIAGRAFAEEARTVSMKIAAYPDGKTVKAADCKLIGVHNSESVLQKLSSYYGQAKKIKMSIVSDGERCGSSYTFHNPFNEEDNGFLISSALTASYVSKADCEFVSGYNPPKAGALYDNYVILTGSGTWDVPESVLEEDNPKIHMVLIGGGTGGEGGYAGEDGASPTSFMTITPAAGGDPGAHGSGGKVYEAILENPPTSISYSCGTGGAGGAISTNHSTNNIGSFGTATTVTAGADEYTSDAGSRLENGIMNAITRDVYAKKPMLSKWGTTSGIAGIANGYGGGGSGGFFLSNGSNYTVLVGGDSYSYFSSLGQQTGQGQFGGYQYPKTGNVKNTGGTGGGGGFGSDGYEGGDATSSKAGAGGNGGDATFTPPKATTYNALHYGWGGFGGGGGGGGGSAGLPSSSGGKNDGGKGGYGGAGGAGGDGCVLIYY